jgi:hypothetical protein
MAAMRRTFAIALVAGLLFLGGCGKARAHQPADPVAPPAATTAPAGTTTNNGAGAKAGQTGNSGVDDLLDQAGDQLSKDDQPAEDED